METNSYELRMYYRAFSMAIRAVVLHQKLATNQVEFAFDALCGLVEDLNDLRTIPDGAELEQDSE